MAKSDAIQKKKCSTPKTTAARQEKWGFAVELAQDLVGEYINDGHATIKEVAELASVSPATVRKFITYKVNDPGHMVVLAICDACGMNLNLPLGNKNTFRLDPKNPPRHHTRHVEAEGELVTRKRSATAVKKLGGRTTKKITKRGGKEEGWRKL